jgi:hypothetical protein
MPLVKKERRRRKVSEEPAEEMEEDDTSADNNVGLNSLRREPLVFCVYQLVLSAVSYHSQLYNFIYTKYNYTPFPTQQRSTASERYS